MALEKCVASIFYCVPSEHEVSSSEAAAVKELFASALSKADVQAELVKDNGYGLPLHRVARFAKGRHAREIFTAVFNAYPSVAKEKDCTEDLPLHTVAHFMGDGDGGLEAIQLLLKEYPQAAKEKDCNGDLPIHHICEYNSKATLAMVRELLSAYPQSINEKDSINNKPYAIAARRKHLPADAIEFLRRAEQDPSIIPPFQPVRPAVTTPNPAATTITHSTAVPKPTVTPATAVATAPTPASASAVHGAAATAALPLETASAANTPQAPAITAVNAPAVFISLRFGEGMPEAKALQSGLHARGVPAFLCDIPEGQDLANAVVMALTHCKLAVILGTKTYGKKTSSGFSTFEELRFIINEQKPHFLVKMCPEFEEAETRFRLPPDISYFPWQPASEAERGRLPAGLVDRIVRRLQDVMQGRSGYVAPPVAAVSMGGPAALVHGTPAATVGTADAAHFLSQWLQALQLDEFEPVLRKFGAVDAHDVKTGFAEGDITKEMLEAEGLKPLRISRLQREANKIKD